MATLRGLTGMSSLLWHINGAFKGPVPGCCNGNQAAVSTSTQWKNKYNRNGKRDRALRYQLQTRYRGQTEGGANRTMIIAGGAGMYSSGLAGTVLTTQEQPGDHFLYLGKVLEPQKMGTYVTYPYLVFWCCVSSLGYQCVTRCYQTVTNPCVCTLRSNVPNEKGSLEANHSHNSINVLLSTY